MKGTISIPTVKTESNRRTAHLLSRMSMREFTSVSYPEVAVIRLDGGVSLDVREQDLPQGGL